MALGVNFDSFYVVLTVNIYVETRTFSFFFLSIFLAVLLCSQIYLSQNICTEVSLSNDTKGLKWGFHCRVALTLEYLREYVSPIITAPLLYQLNKRMRTKMQEVGRNACEGASSSPLFDWSHITWWLGLAEHICAFASLRATERLWKGATLTWGSYPRCWRTGDAKDSNRRLSVNQTALLTSSRPHLHTK